jgi:hypothetical protein
MRKYAILLRVYTPKKEEVEDRVARAINHAHQLANLANKHGGIRKLFFLVPREHDCGNTADALASRLALERISFDIEVVRSPGHHSSDTLNDGVIRASTLATHVIIISGKALGFFTLDVMHKIDTALSVINFRAVGVAVPELRDIVLSGRVQNTFAVWHIAALRDVGLFDAKNGVEEIAPLVHLCSKYRTCIGVLDVCTEKHGLDISNSDTAQDRHKEVMSTKITRQLEELKRFNIFDGEDFFRKYTIPIQESLP